jgi:hypothetical protein
MVDVRRFSSRISLITLVPFASLTSLPIAASAVLEVGARTKSHTADLAKMVDILTDDIKNFLQRWVIIKVSLSGSRKGKVHS